MSEMSADDRRTAIQALQRLVEYVEDKEGDVGYGAEPGPLYGDACTVRAYILDEIEDEHTAIPIVEVGREPFAVVNGRMFTWYDVDLLRSMAAYVTGRAREDGVESTPRSAELEDLADRIASLLPPREP